MKRQRPFAGERNNDGSLTLWYSPDPSAECNCNARPNAPHAATCAQAPRIRELAPSTPVIRSVDAHLRDIARTIGLTDTAERYADALDAFKRRQARNRFNPLATAFEQSKARDAAKRGAAIGR